MHHETIRKTLTHRAGNAPDPSAIAEATLSTWLLVATQLTPVIGVRGVDALFVRSLHITSKTFPWLTTVGHDESGYARLASLRARLVERELADAAEASYTLLATFTEMLASLIGESLTERLLEPVWASPSEKFDQENA